jgi:signal transduction histidine kinase/CheY-like chemotaxis protein
MPFPYLSLSEKNQFKLMKASFAIPLIVFVLGCGLSLYIGYSVHSNEIKSRDAALFFSSKEYSKQFELYVLNNILRIQSLIDVYGSSASNLVSNKKSVEEILKNSFFQRISIYKEMETRTDANLPILKRIQFSKSKKDQLPEVQTPYLESTHLRAKIKSMDEKNEFSGFTISQTGADFFVVLIWHIPDRVNEYVLFTAPMESIFANLPSTTDFKIFISDRETDLSVSVSWNDERKMEIAGGKNVDNSSTKSEKLLVENSVLNYSSLDITWYGGVDRSMGQLAVIVICTGVLISALLALLLRFILNQNRLVANLVIKRTEDLEIALNDATIASLAKSRFLGNMSHELRTPLNLILGMLDLVEEKNVDLKIRDYLKSIRVSGDQLLSLISDLLDMAQKDSGELKVKNEPIRFPVFIEEIAQLIGADARKKNLEFFIDIADDVPEAVNGDPSRLRQILMNLLRNSIKYTIKGSIHLKISCSDVRWSNSSSKKVLSIEVRDSGVGIPKAKQSQIFDRFLQLDSSKVLSQGGVGLGLSIVKDLVELMNGKISVDSEMGVGSTFIIDLEFETLKKRPWIDQFKQKVHADIRVAIISEDIEFIRTTQSCLGSAQVVSIPIFKELLMKNSIGSLAERYSHIILDQNHQLDISFFMKESLQNRIILVGNEKMLKIKPQTFKFMLIDNCPILPSSLMSALGFTRMATKPLQPIVAPPVSSRAQVLAHRNISVHIADDDEGNRQLFAAYFADFQWDLSFSENGKDAFEKYKQNPPDVLIADLRMPIMDGFELTDQVRNFEALRKIKKTPIILVTADALDHTAELSRAHGITSFLTKPIRRAKILDTVFDVIESQSD